MNVLNHVALNGKEDRVKIMIGFVIIMIGFRFEIKILIDCLRQIDVRARSHNQDLDFGFVMLN